MNKLLISSSVAVALGLAGCGGSGESMNDINNATPTVTPISRIVFDPANGNLNIPNDLLMLPGDDGFFDYTLNIPVADTSDFSDPQNALNVLDGWSTQHPFVIEVTTTDGVAIDAATLSSGIHIYEATLGLNQSDPDCAQISIPSAGCKVGDQLQFGVDYVLSLADADTITVVPLKPLKAAQGYMLVMTDDLKDSSGKSVEGSTTWELVRQDINTMPLSSESQLQLQGIVNSYIAPLLGLGYEREDITYVATFTTQSTDIALQSIKQVMVAEFGARAAAGDPTAGTALPMLMATDPEGAANAMEALGLVSDDVLAGAVQQGLTQITDANTAAFLQSIDYSALQTCNGLLGTAGGMMEPVWGAANTFAMGLSTAILQQVGPFCAADHYQATVALPYYLSTPSVENPLAPMNQFWSAACDSGIVLAGAGSEILAQATPGPNYALCTQLGLSDVRINGQMLDSHRNITRFNPVPQMMGRFDGKENLDVQITVPNPAVAAALGFSISMPESGWPVVMLVHGIGSQKEDMLAISGALSLAGLATVAIDQPLHNSRGFDLDGDGTDELNATTVSPIHYMNLASLPTARDNLRQSAADLLGLRLSLNALVDQTAAGAVRLNPQDVSVMGVSLGGISAVNFAAVANSPMAGPLAALEPMYSLQTMSLDSPGGGIAQFVIESAAFGPLVKGSLLQQASPEFATLLEQQFGTVNVNNEQLAAATSAFLANLNDEQLAGINAIFAQFAFAAQSVIDAGDPNNYAGIVNAVDLPVHMMTVVGDGGEINLTDQVVPVTTALPLSGQTALVGVLGLSETVSTLSSNDVIRAWVKFNQGAHASSLNPVPSAAATREMQTQVSSFIATKGSVLPITNTDVIAN